MRSLLFLPLLLLAACATPPARLPVAADVTPFSESRPGRIPYGWHALPLTRTKTPTDYETAFDAERGRVVVVARAKRSASVLKQRLDVDPRTRPWIVWEWRVPQLIEHADNTDRHAEDSPARLLLFFDGDRSTSPAHERAALELAELASGRPVPYATLMYIWENRQPVGTVIPSPFTARVQMIVAASGPERLGQWKRFERDYVADYRRAFGAEPGRLIGLAILTDTDNTGARVEAFYGDIRLLSAAP
jgi:hypothetical protein